MIVVIVVLEVRRVTVDQRVPVLVEPVKDPEPGEAAEAVRPKLVKRARLVEGEALVRDAVAAAACGFGVPRVWLRVSGHVRAQIGRIGF